MEQRYLEFFTEAIASQVDRSGQALALQQARRAGITVSNTGQALQYTGEPKAALVRLIRIFAENNNFAALGACMPILQRLRDTIAKETGTISSPPIVSTSA